MKKRVSIILFAMFLLSVFAVAAATIAPSDVRISVEAEKDVIDDLQKGYGDYIIKVQNLGDDPETFKFLYLDPPSWGAQILPGQNAKQIELAPGEEGQFHVLIKSSDVKPGSYGIRALIQAVDSKVIYDDAVLRIRVTEKAVPNVPPAPDFDVDVSVPSQMDPLGTYNVLVNINNNNARLLENVSVRLNSNILSEETLVTVNPNESKSVSFAVLLFDNIKPQQDQLHVQVDYEGEAFYEGDHNFEVVEYLPPFATDIQVEKSWLKQTRTITVTNEGNSRKEDSLRLQSSLKEKFFSSSDPKFSFTKDAGRYYFAWPVALEAEESTTILLTTSYRILVLLAILLIGVIAYKVATSNPLIVRKKIKAMQKEHGAISNMSVVIYLKNRSKKPLTNVRVVERVARMVALKSDSFHGSMHPTKMHPHDREGTLLEYRFAELTPGDTRIINYKVHSKLQIFGNITIKPTVVEFTTAKGQKKKSRSNTLTVSTDEPQEKKEKSPPRKGGVHGHEHKTHQEHHAHKHEHHAHHKHK